MRDKVLAAIEIYAGGGTIERALQEAGVSKTPFRKLLRTDQEVFNQYEAVVRMRSYGYLDEAYEVADGMGTENGLDPGNARVKADILMKLGGQLHPDRFGQRTNIQVEAKPNLVAAIDEGKRRAALPQRDLANVIEAQYTEIQPITHAGTSDKQSAAPAFALAPGDIDPFAP